MLWQHAGQIALWVDIDALGIPSGVSIPSEVHKPLPASSAKPAAQRLTSNGSSMANGLHKAPSKGRGAVSQKGAEKKDPALLKMEQQLAEEAAVCSKGVTYIELCMMFLTSAYPEHCTAYKPVNCVSRLYRCARRWSGCSSG